MIAHRPCRFVWEQYPEFFRGLGRLRWRLAREAAAGARGYRLGHCERAADRQGSETPRT